MTDKNDDLRLTAGRVVFNPQNTSIDYILGKPSVTLTVKDNITSEDLDKCLEQIKALFNERIDQAKQEILEAIKVLNNGQ